VPISPRLRPDFRKWSLIGRDFVALRETLWPNETKAAAKSSLISANPARTDGGEEGEGGGGSLRGYLIKGPSNKRKSERSSPELTVRCN